MFLSCKLFDTSISFLIASISFFYLYSILPIYFNEKIITFGSLQERLIFISIAITMLLVFMGLIGGFISFLQYLIDHRKTLS